MDQIEIIQNIKENLDLLVDPDNCMDHKVLADKIVFWSDLLAKIVRAKELNIYRDKHGDKPT